MNASDVVLVVGVVLVSPALIRVIELGLALARRRRRRSLSRV